MTELQAMKYKMTQMAKERNASKPKIVEISQSELQSMKDNMVQMQAKLRVLSGKSIAESSQR